MLAPMYLDDLTPGFQFKTESRALSEDDILAFARDWDPQPFHIDPEAARASIYGGIIASGFQTIVLGFRLVLDTGIWSEASMGSPGMDAIRWLSPVRPGDRLHATGEVIAVTPSTTRPDRGRVVIQYRIFTENGTEVSNFRATQMLKRRG